MITKQKILWLDMGNFGELTNIFLLNPWQDHGMGLLRTIMHQNKLLTDIFSLRNYNSWAQIGRNLSGYDILLMNVRSYHYPNAVKAATLFKQINPKGIVIVGGTHASVNLNEMVVVGEFDKICVGAAESNILDIVKDPFSFPKVIQGIGASSMAEWPIIDRNLWPKPKSWMVKRRFPWPLEPKAWGPAPVVTMLTSRVCPWKCSFCNESSYITNLGRRPVDMVIEELNYLDSKYGPIGSIVFHDSMFFQNPKWLTEWLEKYPQRAHKIWPYWAAARADTVRAWPELFESLIRKTNWSTVSIGFESGSNRVLRTLNKECTEEDNYFA